MPLTAKTEKLSFVLRFYRAHLARFFFFRVMKESVLVVAGWLRRLRGHLSHSATTNRYRFVSMADFQTTNNCKSIIFEPSAQMDVPGPSFISSLPVDRINTEPLQLETPRLELVELPPTTVIGATSFIISGNYTVYPNLFDPSRDSSPAETFGVARVSQDRGHVQLYLPHTRTKLDRAATLLGQSTKNYAHWLTETLPRLIILDAIPGFEQWPLLVDDGIHSNLFESIKLFNRNQRDIIRVGKWQTVSLEKLVDISLPAYEPYVPQKLHTNRTIFHQNRFSPRALDMLRRAAARTPLPNDRPGGKKILLRRSKTSNNVRRVVNYEEIEDLASRLGFEIFEPGTMSFSEQIAACRDAEYILAPVGASLANMIFAPSGCNVIALAGCFPEGNYYFYSNLAFVLGHKFRYVLGRVNENGSHPMHRDYVVDIRDLKKALHSIDISTENID